MSSPKISFHAAVFCCVMLCGQASSLQAQNTDQPAYYFDGNEVVFVFDVRNYRKLLEGKDSAQVDFADLRIDQVAISGNFNNWSKKGWHMVRTGEYLFELRKHILSFNDAFPIEFKYIINGKHLVNPEKIPPDGKKLSNDLLKEVYQLNLSVLEVSDNGKQRFFLRGHPAAKEVILTGSFNGWDEHAIKMQKTSEGWELRANLPPGRYEYKFIVDGEWMHDKTSKEFVQNEHGTLNSVMHVTKPVQFNLSGFNTAKEVYVAGSFNDWNPHGAKLSHIQGLWTTTISLTGGKHHYKFIVDGVWMTDPVNPVVENDGNGNLNSVLFVH